MNTFTHLQGLLILTGYGLIIFIISRIFSGRSGYTKSYFLLADRELGKWEGAFSIAATWIWAPALFIAAREAYTRGITGLFWFLVPNILCLIIFARFAEKVRKIMPRGFTLSDYILSRYSKRVQKLYWIELMGLGTCSFAVQLLAGAGVISILTGLPFFLLTVLLTLIALSYSLFSGLKASVVTDYIQMGIMLAVGFILVPWVVGESGGLARMIPSMGGITGKFGNLFNEKGIETAWVFGVPVTIGLLAGPFGDQSFWQRAFSIKEKSVSSSFVLGALIFAIVPLTLSFLGFSGVAAGIHVDNPEYINIEMVTRFLPPWAVVIFTLMLISGLASTLDSNLCAISSITGHDFISSKDAPESRVIFTARMGMLSLAAAAIAISNIPGLKILHLFLFYGTLRASTLLPTLLGITTKRITEKGAFWGIVCSFLVGLPLFTYGKLSGNSDLSVWGAILTVSFSGIISSIISLFSRVKDIEIGSLPKISGTD